MPYSPTPLGAVPKTISEFAEYIYRELQRVSDEWYRGIDKVTLPELHVAPEKPRTGMVVLADGTNFNPGSGAGFYGYRGGAWRFLG